MDTEAVRHLLLVQHSALAKPIIARRQAIGMHEIGYVLGRKALSRSAWSRGCSRAKLSLIEDGGDLGIDMVVEQCIHQFHDLWWCLDLLRRRLWVSRHERLAPATLKSKVDLGNPFDRNLDQGCVFDDVGEKTFAFTVRRGRIIPELA